jgi:hypothetical protein
MKMSKASMYGGIKGKTTVKKRTEDSLKEMFGGMADISVDDDDEPKKKKSSAEMFKGMKGKK